MYASSEKKLDILNDHYKDTFSHLVSYRKQRDRLLLYQLGVVSLQFLYQFLPNETTDIILKVVLKKIGVDDIVLPSVVGILLVWTPPTLFFLILGRRYWQVWNLIENQYNYLQKLEEELSPLFASGVSFTHEGNFSFKNEELSIWSHRFYNLCFRSLCFIMVMLGATFVLRHHGPSWQAFTACIVLIIVFIFQNYEITWEKRATIIIKVPHIRLKSY